MLPLVAEHIIQAEWDALGERGRAGIPKGRKGLLFLGATLEDATEDERRAMLGSMPLSARVTWHLSASGTTTGRPVPAPGCRGARPGLRVAAG